MPRNAFPDMVQPDNINVGFGGSIFVGVLPVPGQVAITVIQRGTSGTLEVAGGGASISFSSSFALNSFTPSLLANGTGFLIPTLGLTIPGPAAFWLSQNTGATISVSLLRQIERPQI